MSIKEYGATLSVNGYDYTNQLRGFRLRCVKCDSPDVGLDVEWTNTEYETWCRVDVICAGCSFVQSIYPD